MPFIDKSTLTYPATNAFPVRKWLDPARDPVSGANGDYKSFRVFDIWINDANDAAWIMVDKTATTGTWVQMAASGTGILTITGDAGGAVGADGANNVDFVTTGNLTLTGNPGTNTLSLALAGTIADTYTTDAGNAVPAAGVINILGAGGVSTSGAGATVTVTAGATIPTSFVSDAGTATPALNSLNVLGGAGIDTTGAGATLTIVADATVATTYTCDAGSATPAASNLNVLGAGSASTSGAGSTVTITSTGGGLTWSEITVVGPTAMSVDNGYVANSASRVQLLLPTTAALGSIIHVIGKGTGGWQINQNAGETILVVDSTTSTGVAGTIQSSEDGATICIVCITADTVWRAFATTGNLIIT